MRLRHAWLPFAFLMGIAGCGEDEAEPEIVAVAAEPEEDLEALDEEEDYVPPEPAHQGTVIMAEDFPVEVVPHADGEVHAYLLDTPDVQPETLSLTVEVPTSEGPELQPMALVYNPSAHRFEGRLNGPHILPGRINVVVEEEGEPYFGHGLDVVVAEPVVVVEGAPRPPIVTVIAPGHPGRGHYLGGRGGFRHRGGFRRNPGRGHGLGLGHRRGGRGLGHGGRRGHGGRGHFGRGGGRRGHR